MAGVHPTAGLPLTDLAHSHPSVQEAAAAFREAQAAARASDPTRPGPPARDEQAGPEGPDQTQLRGVLAGVSLGREQAKDMGEIDGVGHCQPTPTSGISFALASWGW